MNNAEKINKVLPNSHRYINELFASKILSSKYQTQAVDFLIETDTTCDIVFFGLSTSPWSKNHVNLYKVTLSNKKHTYTFDFYDSIKNTEQNKRSTYDFYSVIACLSLDYSVNFDDFCLTYGYEFKNEREYIKTKQVYFDVLDQDKNLRKLFNEDQLNKLAEIN